MADQEHDAPTTNALLSEILGVLRRIDNHMVGQDERLNFLERVIETRQNEGPQQNSDSLDGPSNAHADPNSPNSSPTTKRRLLKLMPVALKGNSVSQELYQISSKAPHDVNATTGPLINNSQARFKLSRQAKPTILIPRNNSLVPSEALSRRGTGDTVPPPPIISISEDASKRARLEDTTSYAEYPPPRAWISTKNLGRRLEVQYGLPDAQALWTSYVGDSWAIPPDGRVELSFQKHLLERLDKDQAVKLLKKMAEVSNKLEWQNPDDRSKRGSFRVSDFDIDPNYQESGADYRSEFSTGLYKERPVTFPRSTYSSPCSTAPWKRVIEIRGLSKRIIDASDTFSTNDHEMWSNGLRNPWIEALPKLNSVCPFLTHREGFSHTLEFDATGTFESALLHHQRCLPYIPSKEDSLCFHITFYELIHVKNEKELEGEIWKSGRLHSDNEGTKGRRIRESACTIVIVCDPLEGNHSKFWTAIYLCPFNFDLYEKMPIIISNQDAPSIAADMIEFTMRQIITRWHEITDYFAWLIGHRDALSDPDTHDSLLFDDDSFSRSRRYFWAINYLAELDVSMAGNIAQLERWIAEWPDYLTVQSKELQAEVRTLPERLEQLRGLQERLRALRQEAFALRDGLFSASGVIESRAATRLGENVKLLTSVSIFFLPLSFCMSVWSVNDTLFSLSSLTIVATIIPLATYLIVFNLNNLVNLISHAYNKQKRALVAEMKKDGDSKWSEQGKRFEIFKPKAEKIEPSDWMLASYLLHKGLRIFDVEIPFLRDLGGRLFGRRKDDGHSEIDVPVLHDLGNTAIMLSPVMPDVAASRRGSWIFGGITGLSHIFRRGALVPGSTAGV